MRSSVTGRVLSALGLSVAVGSVVWAQPLNRQLPAYCLLAMRELSAKNLTVNGACNVGVNCEQPNPSSSCGTASFENPFMATGSQLASDFLRISRKGAQFWQVFRNKGPAIENATFGVPGPKPDQTFPFTPPILADADGDGTPSCQTSGSSCVPDFGDVEAACGFPPVFLACGGPNVIASGGDCIGAPDAAPNNGRCDLAPGVYGNLGVRNGAKLTLTGGGDYAFCNVMIGRNVTADATVPARLFVSGNFNVNNGTDMGLECGDIVALIRGPGGFSIGRGASVTGTYCAPERTLLLGAGATLQGTLVGDKVAGDHNIRIAPCAVAGAVECACFDQFAPGVASVGAVITFTSACDLRTVQAITICGIDASIILTTPSELQAIVPAGANGPCEVKALSRAGSFKASIQLVVQ